MNKLITLFSIALMLAGGARAQTPEPASTKTRAEVIAELQQARASGELAVLHAEVGVNGYQLAPPVTASARPATMPTAKMTAPAAGGTTRAEVVAEQQRARAAGEL